MQSELDQLSSAKTTAIATKQSKQDQIVGRTICHGSHTDPIEYPHPPDGEQL